MSGAKLLQKAAGVQPAVLWGSAAVFDWSWFLIICVSIVISCAAFDVIGLSTVPELGRILVTFINVKYTLINTAMIFLDRLYEFK